MNSNDSTFEDIDALSYKAVDLFLKRHNFPVLDDRLLANVRGKLDAIDILREVCFYQMEKSPEKLIDFYERTYDRKKTLHYENLIDTLLIELATGILSTVIGGIIVNEYSRNRKKIINELRKTKRKSLKKIAGIRELLKKYDKSLKYLFRVYALKEYWEKSRIAFDVVLRLREDIRSEIYDEKYSKNENADETSDFRNFESNFNKVHQLPTFEEESFGQEISDEILSSSLSKCATSKKKMILPLKKPKLSNVFHFTNTCLKKQLDGISAKPGYAAGRVAIVKDWQDCDKVEEGDIMVLIQHQPDFVPASRISGALVGDKGGLTSHTAIIGRELDKPTIVGTEKGTELLKDGMYVFVDAVQGRVYEIINE